nr:hypothetical protein [Tanacetum cinerariifolium]
CNSIRIKSTHAILTPGRKPARFECCQTGRAATC